MIAIFASEAAAQAFCDAVDTAHGYPRAGSPERPYPAGWTLRWAVPYKHPTRAEWAVKVPRGDDAPVSATATPEKLDASWSPAL